MTARPARGDTRRSGRLPLSPNDLRADVFRALVARPHASTSDVAAALGLPIGTARRHLIGLEQDQLIMRVSRGESVGWEALQPATTLREALSERQAQLDEDRQRVQDLSDLYWSARQSAGDAPAVEVLHNPAAINGHFLRLQQDASTQVRALDRPPYLSQSYPDWGRGQVDVQREQMAAGVEYRVVYQRSLFDNAALAAQYEATIARGERARIARSLPVKLTICDDTRALISLEPYGSATDPSALLIYPSALLDALGEIFETYWRAAEPVSAHRGGLSQRQSDVLQLLADGATDETIAVSMHLSTRTVTRTIAELHETLGAATRFQAGLLAASRGYLNTTHLT